MDGLHGIDYWHPKAALFTDGRVPQIAK